MTKNNPFKVGDIVRALEDYPHNDKKYVEKGKLYTVSDTQDDLIYINGYTLKDYNGVYHYRFEPVEETKAMVNYKVGDFVKRVSDRATSGWFKQNPGPFKVVKIDTANKTVDFAIRVGIIDKSAGWDAEAFELAVPAKAEEWIVIVRDLNGLAPAMKPRTYSTQSQAKAVAASMAEKHPGQEFVIFKAVGKAKTATATVEMY